MIAIAVKLSLAILVLAMALGAWRLARGPDAVDRVLAIDTLYINAIALLIAYGVYLGSDHLHAATMIIALLGFVSTVTLARALLRGRVME